MAELKDEVLEEVSGGKAYGPKQRIVLKGGYWANCYATGTKHTAAIGWGGLFIQPVDDKGAKAPWLISDKDGAIGYTVRENFDYI